MSFTAIALILPYVSIAVLGAVLGSFTTALTHRIRHKQQWVSGRSKCPHCHTIIRWFDNIPILSWLLLRGQCRQCHDRISISYPIIEIISMMTALFFYHFLGLSPLLLIVFIFQPFIMALSLIHI